MVNRVLMTTADGVILRDFQIPNIRYGTAGQQPEDEPMHPHTFDLFEPNGVAISGAMICCPGGSATKEQFEQQLFLTQGGGIPTQGNTSWGILKRAFGAAIFVQGQACKGVVNQYNPEGIDSRLPLLPDGSYKFPNGIPTFQNHDQISGVDDVQMIKSLSFWIKQRYGTIMLMQMGHSAGGIFTQRCWFEYATGMPLVYGTLAGPASTFFVGATPPAVVKPMVIWVGDQDINLAEFPDFYSDIYTQTKNFAPIDTSYPNPSTRIGILTSQQTALNAYNKVKSRPPETMLEGPWIATHPGDPSKGNYRLYTGGKPSGGTERFRIVRLSASDHAAGHLQGYYGVDALANFFAFGYSVFTG